MYPVHSVWKILILCNYTPEELKTLLPKALGGSVLQINTAIDRYMLDTVIHTGLYLLYMWSPAANVFIVSFFNGFFICINKVWCILYIVTILPYNIVDNSTFGFILKSAFVSFYTLILFGSCSSSCCINRISEVTLEWFIQVTMKLFPMIYFNQIAASLFSLDIQCLTASDNGTFSVKKGLGIFTWLSAAN